MLQVSLFRTLEVRLEGEINPMAAKRQQLLAYLILHSHVSIEKQHILKALWTPSTPLNTLAQLLHHLKDNLHSEAGRLNIGTGTVSLNLSGVSVDALRFQELANRGDMASLEAAIELYRGRLLEDWDELWLEPLQNQFENRYREIVCRVVEDALARREYRKAVGLILRSGMPRFVWAWETLIKARIEAGDCSEALGDYRQYLDWLWGENSRHRTNSAPSAELEHRVEEARRAETMRVHTHLATPAISIVPITTPNPLPLESLSGSVPLDSPFYVERSADGELLAYLVSPQTKQLASGQTLLIKGARQMGKTSLLHRALAHARQAGAQIVLTDWQNLAQSDLQSPENFFYSLADQLAYELDCEGPTEADFLPRSSSSTNFERFFCNKVLKQSEAPIVWGIDEADRIFDCYFREDVYGKLRAWHNKRSNIDSLYRRLTVILAYSTEAHLFITNPSNSPFNVGEKRILHDLSLSHVVELNRRYGSPLTHESELNQLYAFTNGHPYLVRLVLQTLHQGRVDIAGLEAQAEQEDGIFAEHLTRFRFAFSLDATLKSVVRNALRDGTPPSEEYFVRLCASGLMIGERPDTMRPRCRLYELFLRRCLL